MKKFLFVLWALLAGVAIADNTITSKQYVDTTAGALQPQVSTKNTDAVLVYTDVAGEIGEKKIYNSAEIYNEQPDALVTAGAFNTAMQNALASEFVCVERNAVGCLLYEVRGAVPQRVLPSGYTQLEYLGSTGTQYIDTGTVPTTNTNFEIKLRYTDITDTQGMIGYLSNSEPQTNFYLAKSMVPADVVFASGTAAQRFGLKTISTSVGTLYTYKLTGNSLYINNEVLDVQRGTLSTSNTMYIFSRNNSDLTAGLRAKVYYYKIYDDASLVRNFIPARRDSDGKLGMYDLVSGNFFMNNGTGEFIAGPNANYLLQ